jgi:hypothetical protein
MVLRGAIQWAVSASVDSMCWRVTAPPLLHHVMKVNRTWAIMLGASVLLGCMVSIVEVAVVARNVASASDSICGTAASQWGCTVDTSTALILSHSEENLDWTRGIQYPVYVIGHKLGVPPPNNVPTGAAGREAAAYLRFIIDNWNDLPMHMIFMHAHEESPHIDVSKTQLEFRICTASESSLVGIGRIRAP